MLLGVVAIMVLAISYFILPSLGAMHHQRNQTNAEVLAQASAALIGYAASYRDKHPEQTFGYLPCPDTDNDGVTEPSCGKQGETMIGRLPYSTLGLPELRTADGECLWYVLSASHKNNPKATPLNWDTRGLIRVQDNDGTPLIDPSDTNGGAAAVILSPGTPLAGQKRQAGTQRCGGDASNDLANYLEGNPGGGYTEANTGALTIVTGKANSLTNNDRAAWISARALFTPIAARSDLLGTLLTQLRS